MRAAKVTRTGAGVSAWLPLDPYSGGYGDGLYAKVTGSATYGIEVTPDDIFDPAVAPQAYPCDIVALAAGATTTQSGSLLKAARAVRINQTVGAGSVELTVITRGIV